MSPDHAEPDRTRRTDHGFTLTELVVVVGMVGLVVAVIAAAAIAILRNEGSVTTRVGESHDIQQAVNYFHLDVESGPVQLAAYRATSGTTGTRGTGCSDTGDANVFRYDTDDLLRYDTSGPRRVAYLLSTTTTGARLDRYTCAWDGAGWVEADVVNIADLLPSSGSPVTVSVTSDAGLVDDVTMQFAQSSTTRRVTATPRPDSWLAAADEPCTGNPLEATLGFESFVEGDVQLLGGELEGSLAVGGTLGWAGGTIPIASSNTNSAPFSNLALYASNVDWTTEDLLAPAVLTTMAGGSKKVALGPNTAPLPPLYVVDTTTNPKRAYLDPVGDRIETRGSVISTSDASLPALDFAEQFELLRKCADALGSLPNGAIAEWAIPLDPATGDPYSGSGDMMLRFVDDALGDPAAAVLGIGESKLGSIGTVTRESGSSLNASRPLIVNINDEVDGTGHPTPDGDVVVDFASPDWQAVGDAKFVLYNFPNATGTVTIQQDAYGVVFAPYADVVTHGLVRAQIVAKSWTHDPIAPSPGLVESGAEHKFNSTVLWL